MSVDQKGSKELPSIRESVICDEIFVKEQETAPWRMSIFNEIDAEQKTQIADDESELKNFSMSLSTSATKRNVDVYESNEILNDKAFEISTEKLRIWSHLLKKSLMENFIFCEVTLSAFVDPVGDTLAILH